MIVTAEQLVIVTAEHPVIVIIEVVGVTVMLLPHVTATAEHPVIVKVDRVVTAVCVIIDHQTYVIVKVELGVFVMLEIGPIVRLGLAIRHATVMVDQDVIVKVGDLAHMILLTRFVEAVLIMFVLPELLVIVTLEQGHVIVLVDVQEIV